MRLAFDASRHIVVSVCVCACGACQRLFFMFQVLWYMTTLRQQLSAHELRTRIEDTSIQQLDPRSASMDNMGNGKRTQQ